MNYYEILINWSNNYGALFHYHVYFYKKIEILDEILEIEIEILEKFDLMFFYIRLLSNFSLYKIFENFPTTSSSMT